MQIQRVPFPPKQRWNHKRLALHRKPHVGKKGSVQNAMYIRFLVGSASG